MTTTHKCGHGSRMAIHSSPKIISLVERLKVGFIMSPDGMNTCLTARKDEISRFIRRHKVELFSAALKYYQSSAIPEGMFRVLEAYCIEFYGPERAFQFALEHIAEAALLDCAATQRLAAADFVQCPRG